MLEAFLTPRFIVSADLSARVSSDKSWW